MLVEAAWAAVNSHPHWKEQFQRLCRRKHPNQAITAIARKLLVVVWHVLTECAADTHAEPEMVACKLMVWSWKLTDEQRGGLTSRQFARTCGGAGVRYGLLQLDLGHDLTHIVTGQSTRRAIAPPDEVAGAAP